MWKFGHSGADFLWGLAGEVGRCPLVSSVCRCELESGGFLGGWSGQWQYCYWQPLQYFISSHDAWLFLIN